LLEGKEQKITVEITRDEHASDSALDALEQENVKQNGEEMEEISVEGKEPKVTEEMIRDEHASDSNLHENSNHKRKGTFSKPSPARKGSIRQGLVSVSERARWLKEGAFGGSSASCKIEKSCLTEKPDLPHEGFQRCGELDIICITEAPIIIEKINKDERGTGGSISKNLNHKRDDEKLGSLTQSVVPVSERAKWLRTEAFGAGSTTHNKSAATPLCNFSDNTFMRGKETTVVSTGLSSDNAVKPEKKEIDDKFTDKIRQFGGLAGQYKKYSVIQKLEKFEQLEKERKMRNDYKAFLTTSWRATNRRAGKYKKSTKDSRGVPPKKSLSQLP